jgi:predicted nucleic acid-binding protein
VGVTRYLVDKSALARLHLPPVRDALVPVLDRGLASICGVTKLEMLFSARNIDERQRVKEQLEASLNPVDTPENVWQLASDLQEALTEKGQHRSASIADLVIAVTAGRHRLTVLHYDHDFDTIAAITKQPTQWVVPAGAA